MSMLAITSYVISYVCSDPKTVFYTEDPSTSTLTRVDLGNDGAAAAAVTDTCQDGGAWLDNISDHVCSKGKPESPLGTF